MKIYQIHQYVRLMRIMRCPVDNTITIDDEVSQRADFSVSSDSDESDSSESDSYGDIGLNLTLGFNFLCASRCSNMLFLLS